MENTVARFLFTGSAWLILGVPVTGGLLYSEELEAMQKNQAFLGQLEVSYAISREMKNASGGKLYVQDVLTQRAEELFDRLDKGAVIYFCGLKSLPPPPPGRRSSSGCAPGRPGRPGTALPRCRTP